MKKFIHKLTNYWVVVLLGASFLAPAALVTSPAFAAPSASEAAVCDGVGASSGSSGCSTGGKSLDNVIKFVINLLSLIGGLAAVIMIIVGGLKYITSSGDPTNINSAKNTILYAIIGLVVIALAQIIVKFVLKKV